MLFRVSVSMCLQISSCMFATVHKHPLKEVEISAIVHGAIMVRARILIMAIHKYHAEYSSVYFRLCVNVPSP